MPRKRCPELIGIVRSLWAVWIALGWWLCGLLTASGQTWQVSNWHVDDGLPHGEVTALAQTPDGYLWIGTAQGLARFDGVRFKVFQAGDVTGLTDARIVRLLAARDGTLWAGSLGGSLARLRGQRFEIVASPLPVDEDLQRPPGSWSWNRRAHLVEDGEGGIWWGMSGKGTARFFRDQWRMCSKAEGMPDSIWQMVSDHAGGIWAEGKGQLFRFDGKSWQPAIVQLGGGSEHRLTAAREGGVWLSATFPAGPQVRRLNAQGWLTPAIAGPPPTTSGPRGVTELWEDRHGRLWAGMATGGLSRLDELGRWRPLDSQGSMVQPSVTCLMEDRQGNLWVGTTVNGLFRVVPQPVNMLSAMEAPESVFASVTTRDGRVWIGTRSSGVFRMGQQGWEAVTGEWGDKVPHISNFLEDGHGSLWAAAASGLFRWDGERFERAPAPFPVNTGASVLLEGREGNLWVGGRGVLISWQGDELQRYPVRGEIRSLVEDVSGTLWIGTVGAGLYRLLPESPRQLEKIEAYPASDATTLLYDSRGTLWVGSWGAGLFRYRGGMFEDSSPRSLPAGQIVEIREDDKGIMWMSTSNGIFCIASEVLDAYVPSQSPPLLWRHFSLEQGLSYRYCSGASTVVAGKLWFPDMNQIAVIDPATIQKEKELASVQVESVRADGRELPPVSDGECRVSSETRRFEFQFAALDLTAPGALSFRHKLEGMDAEWVDVGNTRSASYSQLPPGDYRFRVMAGGADGHWHEANAITLKVVPRWWELMWVRLLLVLMLFGMLTGGLVWLEHRKARHMLQQFRMERQLDEERSRIARDIHDEMGAGLTHIQLLSNLARDSSTNAEVIRELDQIQSASHELTRTMDEIVWAVDPEHDTLDSLVNYLARTAQGLLRPAGVRCRLEIPLEIPQIRLTSQTRHHLFLAFKEGLHNVIKHATADEVRFELLLEPARFALVLEDNGKGFALAEKSIDADAASDSSRIVSGHGLKNIDSRLQEAGGQMEITSQSGQGTRLILWMPFDVTSTTS